MNNGDDKQSSARTGFPLGTFNSTRNGLRFANQALRRRDDYLTARHVHCTFDTEVSVFVLTRHTREKNVDQRSNPAKRSQKGGRGVPPSVLTPGLQ